ncbi:Uncharacterized protein SCG7109_AG_00170 [Chlamydiales bacterium SCGC AG-110-M15]|nr:Uncharacterized protein SCG7109_AG_00170 [Chlamydiales bacterium SCGC AG-110-M15]
MWDSPLFWLSLTLLCIAAQAFYSSLEMAIVSFNKVRLQYYVSQGKTRAEWVNSLLQNPARLFGTTLLGVNVALQIGSECSRQFYQSMQLSPDLAPLTQVVLVLILAELAPMFAARHYAEHVSLLGVPIIYATSHVVKPVVIAIGWVTALLNRLFGKGEFNASAIALTRDEIQKVFEESDDPAHINAENEDFNTVVSHIFNLREKTAEQVMELTSTSQMLDSNSTVGHARKVLKSTPFSHIPIYQRSRRNVVGIVDTRALLKSKDEDRALDYAKPPWFITQYTKILQILEQFRVNNQDIAIVLDNNGLAKGLLSLDDVLDEIFGVDQEYNDETDVSTRLIERTFPGEMKVSDFNAQFGVDLSYNDEETLADLIANQLEHHPENGESVRVNNFELTVEVASLVGVKKISIRTVV